MTRPKLDARVTIRLPEELLADLAAMADRRNTLINEVVLTSLENEIARMLTYRLDYYSQIRPLAAVCQGDVVGVPRGMSDTGAWATGVKKVV